MKHYIIITLEGAVKVLKRYCHNRQEALQALREIPEARMMVFSSANDMHRFLTTPVTTGENRNNVAHARALHPEAVNYDGRYDRCFLQAIEAGDHWKALGMIICVPALLINDTYHPRVYTKRGENALHVAARCGSAQICTYILEAIGSSLYITSYQGERTAMTNVLSEKLLELYLNSPERYRYETPIHLAAKNGWASVVRVLISYPQCKLKPNILGHYPQNMICIRATGARTTSQVLSTIAVLLQENYFVPLVRTESNLEPPFIGEPFSRHKLPELNNPSRDILAPQQKITAFAGPMTLVQARQFRKQWQSLPRLTVHTAQKKDANDSSQTGHGQQFLCSTTHRIYEKSNLSQAPGYIIRTFRRRHLDNALERVGRYLATFYSIQWKEYWSFLNVFCDLSEHNGLYMLETYLAHQGAYCYSQQNVTSIAIGGSIRNRENLYALFAISNIEINEQLYPFISRWKRNMLLLLQTE